MLLYVLTFQQLYVLILLRIAIAKTYHDIGPHAWFFFFSVMKIFHDWVSTEPLGDLRSDIDLTSMLSPRVSSVFECGGEASGELDNRFGGNPSKPTSIPRAHTTPDQRALPFESLISL